MVATQLNPTQLYLLQLFSFSQTEESQLDLQKVLQSYYQEKVAKRANELWDKLTETKVESPGSLSGILPLRRLSDMSNLCKFLQLEIPVGMFPSNLFCDKERKNN